MNATVANTEARAYLEAVRVHLADVPESDREELLEDLEGHLLEVAAEADGSLEERLGSPAVYAEELRESAGWAKEDAPHRERLTRRIMESLERSAPGRIIDMAWNSTSIKALRAFLPELRPGWWVLRGYMAVAAAALLSYEGYYTNPVVPHALGGYAQGTALAIAAIVASVLLGKAARRTAALGRLSLIASAAVLVAAFAAVPRIGDMYVQTVYASDYVGQPGLYHADGTPIANICPYASDGKALTGILLFDEGGRPIVDTVPSDDEGFPVEPAGPGIPNAYPRSLERVDPYGQTRTPLACPTILTVPPAPTGVPTPIPGSSD